MDRVVDWCWDPLLLLKNSQARYSGNEKGIFLTLLFRKLTRVEDWFALEEPQAPKY